MNHYRIPDWRKYQHYRDRSPPWVKLHKSLLSSRAWVILDDASRALAIACMMLAGDTDNRIPDDPEYVRRAGCLNQLPEFGPLVESGFLELIDPTVADASNVLADCYREESKAKQSTDGVSKTPVFKDNPTTPRSVDDWKPSEKAIHALCFEFTLSASDRQRYEEAFRDRCRGGDYKCRDFDGVFLRSVKEDWPGFRGGSKNQSYKNMFDGGID